MDITRSTTRCLVDTPIPPRLNLCKTSLSRVSPLGRHTCNISLIHGKQTSDTRWYFNVKRSRSKQCPWLSRTPSLLQSKGQC